MPSPCHEHPSSLPVSTGMTPVLAGGHLEGAQHPAVLWSWARAGWGLLADAIPKGSSNTSPWEQGWRGHGQGHLGRPGAGREAWNME